jgi:hypothetical protein
MKKMVKILLIFSQFGLNNNSSHVGVAGILFYIIYFIHWYNLIWNSSKRYFLVTCRLFLNIVKNIKFDRENFVDFLVIFDEFINWFLSTRSY